MRLNRNIVALRKGKIIVRQKKTEEPTLTPELFGILRELKELGYILSQTALASLERQEIIDLWHDITEYAEGTVGANGHYWKPVYPGFPDSVKDLTEEQMKADQEFIYINGILKWEAAHPEHKEADEVDSDYPGSGEIVLEAIEEPEYLNIYTRLLGSKTSLSLADKEILQYGLEHESFPIPDQIGYQENLAIGMWYIPELVWKIPSVNDILRMAAWASYIDPCLPCIPKDKLGRPEYKFSKFNRADRKKILLRVDLWLSKKDISKAVLDAMIYRERWLRLAEICHPSEYKNRFPKSYSFFEKLRDQDVDKSQSFWSRVHQEYAKAGKSGPMTSVIEVISERPGVLVRRFDSLLRRSNGEDQNLLIQKLLGAPGIEPRTLLDLSAHLDRRGRQEVQRSIVLKGYRERILIPCLKPLDPDMIEVAQTGIAWKLRQIWSETKESLAGHTYWLDPDLKFTMVPKGGRTQTTGKIGVSRGTGMPFKRHSVIRFFCHWIQEKRKHEDLDLHAIILDPMCNKAEPISWNTALRGRHDIALHSGDVLGRPGHCAEYIDIRPDKAVQAGYRWVVCFVNNYMGRGLDTLPVWLGYLEVSKMKSGKDWQPSDVIQSLQPKSESQTIIGFLIDLERCLVYLIDEDLPGGVRSINIDSARNVVDVYGGIRSLNTYELLKLSIQARGGKIIEDTQEIPEETIKLMASDFIQEPEKLSEWIL